MAKINWLQAKKDYISDESLSYEKIAKKYGVSKMQVARVAKKQGWVGLRKAAIQNANEMLPKKTGDAISDINARHVQTGKILQTKSMRSIIGDPEKGIDGFNPGDFEVARKGVVSGVAIERKAAGLDKSEQAPQINILNLIQADRKKYGF